MPKITVLPLDVEIEVGVGENVFRAATDTGFAWPTVCEGMGSCRTCYMTIIEGIDSFDEPDDWELEGLDDLTAALGRQDGSIRLACQALVRGDAIVRRTGVKPPQV